MTQVENSLVTDAMLAEALAVVRASGYVVIKEKSYLAAQERQRLAKVMQEYERDRREGAERWARAECAEERRLRDRLTFIYGVAIAHGASREDLRDENAEYRAALERLVRLKDGERGPMYELEKPLAWHVARETLGIAEPEERTP